MTDDVLMAIIQRGVLRSTLTVIPLDHVFARKMHATLAKNPQARPNVQRKVIIALPATKSIMALPATKQYCLSRFS